MKNLKVVLPLLLVAIVVIEVVFLFRESHSSSVPLAEQESMSMQDTDTTVDKETAGSVSEQNMDAETSPYLKVIFRSPSEDLSLFDQGADIFVSTGGKTVGKDSRTGRVEREGSDHFERTSDGLTKIEIDTFGPYDKQVEVSVVGLLNSVYELTVILVDESGQRHEFTYASSTNERVVDDYSFNIISGEEKVRRVDHLQERPVTLPVFEAGDGLCDVISLKQQLPDILSKNGWDMEAVPLVNTETGYIDALEIGKLPFDTDKVCAIQMVFREEFLNEVPEETERKDLVGLFHYTGETIEIGGKSFGQSPADGPLGSLNIIPLTETGRELQLLQLEERSSLIPVHFPAFSVCPCAHEYRAILTAPMYP